MLTARRLRLRFALSRRAAARRPLFLVPAVALTLSTARSDRSPIASAARQSAATPALDKGPGTGIVTAPKTATSAYDHQARTR